MSVWGKFLFLLLSLFDWWHDRFSDSVQFFTLHPTQGGAAPDPWGQIINSHLLFQSRNALYNKRGIAAKQKFQVFSINERHYCQFSVSPASAHHIYFRLVFRTIFVRNKNLKKLIIGNFTWAKTLFTLYIALLVLAYTMAVNPVTDTSTTPSYSGKSHAKFTVEKGVEIIYEATHRCFQCFFPSEESTHAK